MDNSPLGRLPPEIREVIYTYALYFEDGIHINVGMNSLHIILPTVTDYPLALTSVCKRVRTESASIFYSINIFHLRPLPGDSRSNRMIETWLGQIGVANKAAISRVDMELGLWTPGYTPPSSATRFTTPLPVQAAQYINCFRNMNVPVTFSMNIKYSDIPGLGGFRLSEVDLVREETVFGTQDSEFEQSCLDQAAIIEDASLDSKLESHAVIRLMMGLDRCRNSFAEFLDAIRDRVERRVQ